MITQTLTLEEFLTQVGSFVANYSVFIAGGIILAVAIKAAKRLIGSGR